MDELDTVGPVDYRVVELPGVGVSSEVLSRLVDLVDLGIVRLLDLAFVPEEAGGSMIGIEVSDLNGDGELDIRALEGAVSGLVGRDEMAEAAAVIETGRAAARGAGGPVGPPGRPVAGTDAGGPGRASAPRRGERRRRNGREADAAEAAGCAEEPGCARREEFEQQKSRILNP